MFAEGLLETTSEKDQQTDYAPQPVDLEPKLPKGYRHIRSAIEALLEIAGEHQSN
jgi:hypothetical protein